jgi:hypothetical protein
MGYEFKHQGEGKTEFYFFEDASGDYDYQCLSHNPNGLTLTYGIPHDIMDHFPDDNNSIESELLAIGALLYVRDQDFSTVFDHVVRHPPATQMAASISLLYSYLCSREKNNGKLFECPLAPCGSSYSNLMGKISEGDDDILEDALVRLRSKEDNTHFDVEDEDLLHIQQYIDDATPWLVKGYLDAMDRYGNNSRADIRDIFIALQQELFDLDRVQIPLLLVTFNPLSLYFRIHKLFWTEFGSLSNPDLDLEQFEVEPKLTGKNKDKYYIRQGMEVEFFKTKRDFKESLEIIRYSIGDYDGEPHYE